MEKHLSYEERMIRVEDVIQELGLSKCVNSVIGHPERDLKSLSGGERKRLAFASEVATNIQQSITYPHLIVIWISFTGIGFDQSFPDFLWWTHFRTWFLHGPKRRSGEFSDHNSLIA